MSSEIASAVISVLFVLAFFVYVCYTDWVKEKAAKILHLFFGGEDE